MPNNDLLRGIPKVDELLRTEKLSLSGRPHNLLVECVHEVLDGVRRSVLSGSADSVPSLKELADAVLRAADCRDRARSRSVINATGVVLHTNLGRAPMAAAAAQAAAQAAASYTDLEYDLSEGRRGSRGKYVEALLTRLTGAEAAVVVNNNAAAVLLILSALGKGREAIISRGELVEIGGSFRVPDIMESCGCILREVGTTNKTRLSDYEHAIGQDTFAIIKVHTSNFRITGFTEAVPPQELAELAHSHSLPFIIDLGSGALYPPAKFGVTDEPDVLGSVRSGADLISFSGDKLLGGPQAGIVVGGKSFVDIIRAHPLMRAMRVDKMTLAALEATLTLYLFGDPEKDIPTISMLTASLEALHDKAMRLAAALTSRNIPARVVPIQGAVGGGSAPAAALDGWAVAIDCESPGKLERRLRTARTPVIARIFDGLLCLDVRTMTESDLESAVQTVEEVYQ